MGLAAIYDVHGNLPALEAVLAEIMQEGVDQIVVGGDIVPGPMPQETLARLREVDVPIHFVRGNGEVAVLAEMGGKDPHMPEKVREVISWNAQQLSRDDEQFLNTWPLTYQANIDEIGKVLFCHATPQNENDIFTRLTPEKCLPFFTDVAADLVVCGHTHMQFDRRIARTRVVNAGSVGMPFGKPGAHWLLLDPRVQLRQTRYDLAAAAERIRNTDYPKADEFAERNVLHPPSEEEMLKVFGEAEPKI